ncbi:uncharacterized protein [Epargyreus clarus]|uniref:uncharacterized protein n=1 Tax=Epargyreus clarus TaxID=520877 RepID=UPI003C2AEF4F
MLFLRSVTLFTILILIGHRIKCLPINNGFSIKLNPISWKEEDITKINDALFAKIPQELPDDVIRKAFPEEMFSPSLALATGYTNEIAKILFPMQRSNNDLNDTPVPNQLNFINVPIIKQDATDYKILIVSAPQNFKLGKEETKHMLVYIVFPTDDINDPLNIPTVYFVNKSDGKLNFKSKEKVDPILIIDSNRTVTGLKSKEVSKYVKFKNKFTNRINMDGNR